MDDPKFLVLHGGADNRFEGHVPSFDPNVLQGTAPMEEYFGGSTMAQIESEHDSDCGDSDEEDEDELMFNDDPKRQRTDVENDETDGAQSACKKSRGRPLKGDESVTSPSCRWIGCGQVFPSAKEARAHERSHGSNHDRGLYICRVNNCCKEFKSARQLRKHLNLHQPKSLFCEVCGKGFHDIGKLQRHIKTHSGDKPFECPECGKEFGLRANLKTHMRVHTGERPYVCNFPGCSKKFAQACNRNTHYQTHLKKESPLASSSAAASLQLGVDASGLDLGPPSVSFEFGSRDQSGSLMDAPSLEPRSSSSARDYRSISARAYPLMEPPGPSERRSRNQTHGNNNISTQPTIPNELEFPGSWPRTFSLGQPGFLFREPSSTTATSGFPIPPIPSRSTSVNLNILGNSFALPPNPMLTDFSRSTSAASQLVPPPPNLEPINHTISDFGPEADKPAPDMEDASLLLLLQSTKWA